MPTHPACCHSYLTSYVEVMWVMVTKVMFFYCGVIFYFLENFKFSWDSASSVLQIFKKTFVLLFFSHLSCSEASCPSSSTPLEEEQAGQTGLK